MPGLSWEGAGWTEPTPTCRVEHAVGTSESDEAPLGFIPPYNAVFSLPQCQTKRYEPTSDPPHKKKKVSTRKGHITLKDIYVSLQNFQPLQLIAFLPFLQLLPSVRENHFPDVSWILKRSSHALQRDNDLNSCLNGGQSWRTRNTILLELNQTRTERAS